MRSTMTLLTLGLTIILVAVQSTPPSSGQERVGWNPCGCFCGFTPPYPPVPPDPVVIFSDHKNCTGILAADACKSDLANLPRERLASICQKVKASKGTPLSKTCPLFAQYCDEPQEKPVPEKKCEKPAPWFGTPTPDCKDIQYPQVTLNQSRVTLSLCGFTFFGYNHLTSDDQPNIAFAEEFKADLISHLKSRIGSRICCDKFREAVNTGVPCDPRADLDCDGKPNNSDETRSRAVSVSVPDIDVFSRRDKASIDPFPSGLDPDDNEFFPPQDKCDCKWELVKGSLNCSPDGKQRHFYEARWRCPSTGNERYTRKYAAATTPCP